VDIKAAEADVAQARGCLTVSLGGFEKYRSAITFLRSSPCAFMPVPVNASGFRDHGTW